MGDPDYTIPNLARGRAQQRLLFPADGDELLRELAVPGNLVEMWIAAGWLSYDPRGKRPLTEAEEAELRFVSSVLRSGMSYGALCEAFAKLDKPYAYNVGNVVWDFGERRWRDIPSEVRARLAALTEDDIHAYIDQLVREGDVGTLASLLERLQDEMGRDEDAEGEAPSE